MKILDFGRSALGICASVVAFTGCSASQAPVGLPNVIPSSSAPGMPDSTALPQLDGTASDDYKVSTGLLYVALSGTEPPYDQVNVYETGVAPVS
jgi:hypothetical protein